MMLEREGIELNRKKLYRLYQEERLMVRKRGGRKRALGTRAPMTIPRAAICAGRSTSSRHACDGRRFRILDAGRRLHPRMPDAWWSTPRYPVCACRT